MDQPIEKNIRDMHFMNSFAIGAGVCLGLVALFIIVNVISMLASM